MTLSNLSERNVAIYWIDLDGKEQFVKRLTPGQSYKQDTFIGHVWRVRDEASGEIVKDVVVKNRAPSAMILILDAAALGPTLVPTITLPPPPALITDIGGCTVADPGYSGYDKFCAIDNIKILAHEKVQDKAIQQAWYIVSNMLAARPDVREQLSNRGTQVLIIGIGGDVSDLPPGAFIDPDDAYAVAEGSATPFVITGEGNLLCRSDDYYGYNILIHEFAHTMHLGGFNIVEQDFDRELSALYSQAMAEGMWQGHYAATDKLELWAEGVVMYFDASPVNYENHYVNRKAEFKEYDPDFYALVEETFCGLEWSPVCP